MTIDQPDLDDLREVLDASFGDGPALPAPLDRLAAGRRSLRRRRLAGAIGSAAAVAVVVAASFAVLGPSGSRTAGRRPGGTPAPSAATPSASDLDAERQAELDRLAQDAKRQAERIRRAQLVSNQFPGRARHRREPGGQGRVGGHPAGARSRWATRRPRRRSGVVVTDGQRIRWMLLTLERADEAGNLSRQAVQRRRRRARATAGSRTGWPSMVAISGGAADVAAGCTGHRRR